MFRKWPIALTGLIISCFSEVGLSQQNLFNVPSSDITEKNKVFIQQQFNFASLQGSSNTTLDYGLGDNLEVGINVFNVDMYSSTGEFTNPNFLLNFQKGFHITEAYKMSFGTQTGVKLPFYSTTVQMPSFSYVNNALNLEEWGKYYVGAYYANHAYAGAGDSVGLMAGIEYPLSEKKVHFMGDILTGNNDISIAVLGFVVFLPKDWQLSFGAQLPAPSSNNDYGMVFEITKL